MIEVESKAISMQMLQLRITLLRNNNNMCMESLNFVLKYYFLELANANKVRLMCQIAKNKYLRSDLLPIWYKY